MTHVPGEKLFAQCALCRVDLSESPRLSVQVTCPSASGISVRVTAKERVLRPGQVVGSVDIVPAEGGSATGKTACPATLPRLSSIEVLGSQTTSDHLVIRVEQGDRTLQLAGATHGRVS